MSAIIERLRNWRRVTPKVSGSGGVHATGADGATGGDLVTGAALECRRTLDLAARQALLGLGLADLAGLTVALERLVGQAADRFAGVTPTNGSQQGDGRKDDDQDDCDDDEGIHVGVPFGGGTHSSK